MNLLKKIARLLKRNTSSRSFPSEISSGMVLAQEQGTLAQTTAGKIAMIAMLLGGQDVCPTCGHVEERAALISEDVAKELLGFKK